MVVAGKSKVRHQITSDAAVAGVLALLVEAREQRVKDDKSAVKTAVLLSNAGLSIDDIAAVTGKKYDAVRVALNRATKKS
jgi:hypothetical protein